MLDLINDEFESENKCDTRKAELVCQKFTIFSLLIDSASDDRIIEIQEKNQ